MTCLVATFVARYV